MTREKLSPLAEDADLIASAILAVAKQYEDSEVQGSAHLKVTMPDDSRKQLRVVVAQDPRIVRPKDLLSDIEFVAYQANRFGGRHGAATGGRSRADSQDGLLARPARSRSAHQIEGNSQMVARNTALNARQLEVLRWISDGCPQGVMQDFTYKLTAVALRSRRLVTLTKRGGWAATVTDAGLHYLEHGCYPEAPLPKSGPGGKPSQPKVKPTDKLKPSNPAPPSRQAKPAATPTRRPEASKKQRPTTEAQTVVVPARLIHPHAVVAQLRDDPYRLDLSGTVRNRALRIIQGLAATAEQEGWRVEPVASRRDDYERTTWESGSDFVICTDECRVGIRFVQEKQRSPHVPTKHELAERSRYAWAFVPKYDYTLIDRLRLEFKSAYCPGQRSNWADRVRWSLEDKLPQVIEGVAARSEYAMQQRIIREEREVEFARQRELAEARARDQLRENHRAEALLQQCANWHLACELRTYLDAATQQIEVTADPDEAQATGEWLEWGRRYAEDLDPLNSPIAAPPDSEPSAEELRAFLRG